jgi:hypothetical protein
MCKNLGLDPDSDWHQNGKSDQDQNDAATTPVSQYGGRITYVLIEINVSSSGALLNFS